MPTLARRAVLVISSLAAAFSLSAFGYGEPDPSFQPTAVPGWQCDDYTIATLADDSAFLPALEYRTASQAAIIKFTPAGAPDPTWGASGVVGITDIFSRKVFVPAADNGLYVIGNQVIRYLKDGSIDPAWVSGDEQHFDYVISAAMSADGGLAILGQRQGSMFLEAFDASGKSTGSPPYLGRYQGLDTIYSWSIDSQGHAEVATYSIGANGTPFPRLQQYTGNQLTQTLSPQRLIPAPGVVSWLSPAVGVEPSGGVVFFRVNPSDQSMSLVRYGPDGSLDPAYAGGGTRSIPMRAFTFQEAPYVSAKALWRSSSGAWTAVTFIEQLGGGFSVAPLLFQGTVALRFLADGTPDPAFTQFASLPHPYQLAHLDSGKILRSDFNVQSCKLARELTDDVAVEATMVEYFHPVLQHYFMTLDTFEAALLDDNVATLGWVRTGRTFGAWPPVGLAGTTPACRFYGDPVIGPNSHFYSTDQFECDALRALELAAPPGVPVWHLEGYTFSAVTDVAGTCPANLAPVYRAFSGPVSSSAGPNHRYTTDTALYDEMLAKGFLPEGVHFCVPPRTSRTTND
jgi:hypothetical protein